MRFVVSALTALIFIPFATISAQQAIPSGTDFQACIKANSAGGPPSPDAIHKCLPRPSAVRPTATSPSSKPQASLEQARACMNFFRTLGRSSRGTDVTELQNFLTQQGYLATGNNTGYFGALTEAAVKQFQSNSGVVSSGTPETTGYGSVGPKTRNAMHQACGKAPSAFPGTLSSSTKQLPDLQSLQSRIQELMAQIQKLKGGDVNAVPSAPPSTSTSEPTNANTTVTPNSNGSCAVGGRTIANDASATAYRAASVPNGSECMSESRTCSNGTLSGTYQYASCSVASEWKTKFDASYATWGSQTPYYADRIDDSSWTWYVSPGIDGLVSMYEATGDVAYMEKAKQLIDVVFSKAWYSTDRQHYGWLTPYYSKDGKRYPYLVHDGYLIFPIARFAKVVKQRPTELAQFQTAAAGYVNTIETRLIHQWDSAWTEQAGGYGYYTNPYQYALDCTSANDTACNYPAGSSVPFNYMTAYGTALLELYRATGKTEYRDRAAKLGAGLKRGLGVNSTHNSYYWLYGGSPLSTDPSNRNRLEDTAHANPDVMFAYQLYKEGQVFTAADMDRFVNTFISATWSWSLGYHTTYVDGTGGSSPDYSRSLEGWLDLAAYDSRVWNVANTALHTSAVSNGSSPAYPATFAKMLLYDPSAP